ncbi:MULTISPECIES: hypothetical protein [unclassified Rhizobacter]|uniref:hypothetical protein n=1 Tax=unclassified Rhizobacter TaxID=2640088 RepID=UPI0006F97272|nr:MULTISPECIES: hypothetical protein [unclassified Rhizobacter]KQU80987.1 hypothetical protein ASC88_15775 [Rhizobacter sp. Root29]KQW04531.1 hypothetical protein ASC98_05465 [Rhizobacter sp. Root1238]KRB06373.1 hypothetical protein ASE08_12020 [Rhizobacter sp. Root16D2]
MSSTASTASSLVRTGAKAGVAFASSVAMGGLMALLLGGGVFFFYLSRLSGPGMPAGAHAGGAGAILALLFSPSLLVGMLLLAFVPIYLMLGVARGRSRAIQQVVAGHGEALSQRLTDAIAGRIEAMPRTKGALEKVSEAVSADAISQQLAPVLGQGRAVRGMVKFAVNRLPLADLMAQWQQGRATEAAVEPGAPDPALRALLGQRIDQTLKQAATPSRTPLYVAMAAQAALLAVGLWLTR